MAVASLTKLTVPLQTTDTQGLLMPKLKYRFRVSFDGFGVSKGELVELTKQIMDFTRPSVSFEDISIPIYNSTIKLAGKHSWGDVTCTLRDDAKGNISGLVGEQLQKQLDFTEQASASSGIDYKFTTILEILDGGNGDAAPVALETWQLYGCYLSEVNYGDLNYGTSEPVSVALTIKYDNAMQTPSTQTDSTSVNGVGASITTTRNNVATGVTGT